MKKISLIFSVILSVSVLRGANPYLPLWEHIPDGEPYIFDDPDRPGYKRVYIYGSHDMLRDQYCGTDQVVWSAPVDSLDNWRYDGVIFTSRFNACGRPFRADTVGDVLYAPDVAMVRDSDGTPVYYLYPNNQAWKRQTMVARSRRPDGPYEVINWSAERPDSTVGILGFDPAVFVDDDGRVYGYWGFGHSMGAELDPETMATLRPGTQVVDSMISSYQVPGIFRFFEASSMRKIEDKYVFIYSRFSDDGEWGLPATNYTLAYAYSDSPLGPFTYGGTLIDCRGRDTDADGRSIATATPVGNTHGSLCKIGQQWWLFYHRQTGLDEFSRQAMVAPVEVSVVTGPGGKVTISEAEYTSEGFETDGLDPMKCYPAAIASHFTGSRPAYQVKYPRMRYFGPYFEPLHHSADSLVPLLNQSGMSPFDLSVNYN
ncbi:MAG: family 43 glycosylhydrolase, partial [Duncaniella sp.]|nr:family 43 glycosylhydrolase [Duncaniella sp.]